MEKCLMLQVIQRKIILLRQGHNFRTYIIFCLADQDMIRMMVETQILNNFNILIPFNCKYLYSRMYTISYAHSTQ
jgi:hypothetical protein